MRHNIAMRHECSAQEIKALNEAMWGVVAELKGLIAPDLRQEFKPLAGLLCLPLRNRQLGVNWPTAGPI